jgi:hypothetical protein
LSVLCVQLDEADVFINFYFRELAAGRIRTLSCSQCGGHMPFVHCDRSCGNLRCPHGLCIVCFMRYAEHYGPSRFRVKPENFLPGGKNEHMRVWSCSPPPTGKPQNNFFPLLAGRELLPPAAPRGVAVHVWDALDLEAERELVSDSTCRFFISSLPNFYGSVTTYKHVASLENFGADVRLQLGDDGSLPLELVATMLVAHASPSRKIYFNRSMESTSDLAKTLAGAVCALQYERSKAVAAGKLQSQLQPPHIVFWLLICSMDRESKEIGELVRKIGNANVTVVLFGRAPCVVQCQAAFQYFIERVRRSPAGADPVQQLKDATKLLDHYKPYLYSRGQFVDVVASGESDSSVSGEAAAAKSAGDDRMDAENTSPK